MYATAQLHGAVTAVLSHRSLSALLVQAAEAVAA